MDVSGWTIEQRSRFPPWCFGSRSVISARIYNEWHNEFRWSISDVGLPDPCMIWKLGILFRSSDNSNNSLRFALADTVPTTEAEMDAALEILPDYGDSADTPERIYLFIAQGLYLEFDLQKPMVTGGKKLVVEGYCFGEEIKALIHVVVSTLPTHMAGWLAHSKV